MNKLSAVLAASRIAIAGGVMLTCASAALAQVLGEKQDPLRPLTACLAVGPHKINTVDRLSPTASHRMVETENGARAVSTADGYRIVLSWPGGGVFANLKVEQSVRGRFTDDREAIMSQMRRMAARAPLGAPAPSFQQRSGVEIVQLQQRELAVRGPAGFMTLFDSRTEAVITAFLMNESAQGGVYAKLADYERQRDAFVDAAVFCLGMFTTANATAAPRSP